MRGNAINILLVCRVLEKLLLFMAYTMDLWSHILNSVPSNQFQF